MKRWARERQELAISTITELELLSLSSLTPERIQEIEDVIATFTVIPLDSHIARIAAILRRQYRILTPDSAIAATAMAVDSPLATRDIGHFEKIKELNLERI
ncbi:hypothetical protein A3J36_00675 [Candidatus Uhrbacteria bacterium RIFCSPLOWO2_02_FULL_54_37]|uniref:PIN domain-containing protein n=2 Tax=Candidatus Uhriibacteriota TaxID=1752732 RepID=A0A1F7VHG0_9BACT|nr:MAG: hypothetical protein A3B36_00935 [Candidatus Uhrbacteria bacterium RIFCSPLOWO2_01_FULL_55_36]OGL89925.1 MAG: hypothetical protein A3J36_00675 [Candidatus Uhrbacteria bacterium RIFCSPLOWO2_02_FULL_54_37]